MKTKPICTYANEEIFLGRLSKLNFDFYKDAKVIITSSIYRTSNIIPDKAHTEEREWKREKGSVILIKPDGILQEYIIDGQKLMGIETKLELSFISGVSFEVI